MSAYYRSGQFSVGCVGADKFIGEPNFAARVLVGTPNVIAVELQQKRNGKHAVLFRGVMPANPVEPIKAIDDCRGQSKLMVAHDKRDGTLLADDSANLRKELRQSS